MNKLEYGISPEGKELPDITHPHFVLLLGVSGVGKSTLLHELHKRDPRLELNTVWTNRAPRDGDVGRKHLPDHAIDVLAKNGFILTDSPAYGNRYVIRRDEVERTLVNKRIPMQDYPIALIPEIRETGIPVLSIYIAPPGIAEWRQRLFQDERDINGGRFELGLQELKELSATGYQDPRIDEVVINDRLEIAVPRLQSLIYRYVTKPPILG